MSRKSSNVYEKSSFDALESTRRLSEEMKKNATTTTPKGPALTSILKESATNDFDDIYENGHGDGTQIEKEGSDHQFKQSNDNDNNNNFKVLQAKNQTAGNADVSETFIRFDISRESQIPQNDDAVAYGDECTNGMKEGENTVGKSNLMHGVVFDQRSVSDSDLDSADDFSDADFCDKGEDETDVKDSNQKERRRSQSYDEHNSFFTESEEQRINNTNCKPLESKGFSSEQPLNVNGSLTSPIQRTPKENAIEQHNLGSEGESMNSNEQLESLKTGDFAQLTKEEIDSKLGDDDVIRQGELLETVRQVGVTNLNKLQKLNWNDPTLRRLFMKPKINAVEVSSMRVDPDIKNMVNEFLKTNVTENFVISRVLRENYVVFYSWLASHLQTERNAWTTRLAQALDQADQERKMSLTCRNSVVEAAMRLRMLVRTSSSILFGIPDQGDETFFKDDSLRRRNKNAIGKHENNRKFSTERGYASDGNSSFSKRGGAFPSKKSHQDKKGNLAPSNYRLVKVTDSNQDRINYDSDPGETMPDPCFNNEIIVESEPYTEDDHSRTAKKSNMSGETKNSTNRRSTNIRSEKGKVDGSELYSGYDLDGSVMDDAESTDWNQVLVDNIDVLTDICDTLLVDRKACLQIVKANPKRCESLVDAVSAFVKKRQNDVNNKRDIEKRLRTLEKENKCLQDEMAVLQKTLADKNRDALNLQTQLNRLETMVQSCSAPKNNKCVGTNEEMFPAVFKNNLTVSCNKTPKQNNQNQSKLSKSPRSFEKEGKSKRLELPSVNGHGNVKHPRQKLEYQKQILSVDVTKESEKRSSPDIPEDTSGQRQVLSPTQQVKIAREPSLVEISEEKLKTLKHRAKKLEDSLHDAINSMERLNVSTQQIPGSLSSSNAFSPLNPLYNKNKVNTEKNGPKTFRRWQKASFEVNIKPLEKNGPDFTSTPRVAVIKRSDSFSKQNDSKDQSLPEIRVPFNSEVSSLLEGRSVLSTSRDTTDITPAPSTSRVTSEKAQGLTFSSNSNLDDYVSDDERPRHDNDGVHTYRRENDQSGGNAPSQTQVPKARRLRARHNTSRLLGGKQTVSKCLRCHKLFSPIDNHKLACCYHTKEKERLEHYDHSGMLLRVMYAWKCCHEPQESEGCCYGQHV